jgi:protein-S-isoprenylcysteine O-methyltransferase Ste14
MFGRYSGRDQGRLVFDRRKIPLLIGIAALCPLFMFSTSSWSVGLQKTIQILGVCAIIICIIGRTWCSSFIAGRKTYELVKVGPYSIIRHPLYAFSIIGAAGVGGQSGTVSLAILSAVYLAIVLRHRILDEEREMLRIHGDSYRDYMARVPRLFPLASSWRYTDNHAPGPQAVLRTFIDSCYLLLAVPFAEILEHLQRSGGLHAALWLP